MDSTSTAYEEIGSCGIPVEHKQSGLERYELLFEIGDMGVSPESAPIVNKLLPRIGIDVFIIDT